VRPSEIDDRQIRRRRELLDDLDVAAATAAPHPAKATSNARIGRVARGLPIVILLALSHERKYRRPSPDSVIASRRINPKRYVPRAGPSENARSAAKQPASRPDGVATLGGSHGYAVGVGSLRPAPAGFSRRTHYPDGLGKPPFPGNESEAQQRRSQEQGGSPSSADRHPRPREWWERRSGRSTRRRPAARHRPRRRCRPRQDARHQPALALGHAPAPSRLPRRVSSPIVTRTARGVDAPHTLVVGHPRRRRSAAHRTHAVGRAVKQMPRHGG